jgi:hypothetical protein
MYKINITKYNVNAKWHGDNCEWSLCNYYGIKRNKRDATPFYKGADIEINGMAISVKSSKASICSGRYVQDCETPKEMFDKFLTMDKADTYVYVTNDLNAYYMNEQEFTEFVKNFHWIGREAKANGGYKKLMINKESKIMVKWLEEKCA